MPIDKTEILKKCYSCGEDKPMTSEYFIFDKRKDRQSFYGSCRDCTNEKKRNRNKVKKVGKYDTDSGIKKRARDYSLSGELLELQRARLILLDRIRNKSHIIFNGTHMKCNICNTASKILTPISVDLLNEALLAFKKAHIHE